MMEFTSETRYEDISCSRFALCLLFTLFNGISEHKNALIIFSTKFDHYSSKYKNNIGFCHSNLLFNAFGDLNVFSVNFIQKSFSALYFTAS